jgi:hypothetical protein
LRSEKHANSLKYFCGFLVEGRVFCEPSERVLEDLRELIAFAGLVFSAAVVADFYSRWRGRRVRSI